MGSIAHSSPSQMVPSHGRMDSGGGKPYVVVIFGRTGVGVSSLVNLIVGYPPVSNDHPDAKGCVRKPKPRSYPPVTLLGSDKQFCLYEVPGFCGDSSNAEILKAIRELDRREGIDLFIYCLRKLKSTVMPEVVRHIRENVADPEVPMIAVVTELEKFEAEGGMEDWWDTSLGGGVTNGVVIEQMCFGDGYEFDAHACITTLSRRDVDLVEKLRKRREISEERMRGLILGQCRGHKRPGRGE